MNLWYWVKFDGLIESNYLVSADTPERACSKVAPNSGNTTATLATWGSLRAFLHARIPHNNRPDDIARGSIPIKIGEHNSYIHHSI